MTDLVLFNGDPCTLCDHRRRETEGVDFYCGASPSGERDCTLIADLKQLQQITPQVAMLLRRISDRNLRREIAERTAEGFSEACYLQGRGVSFDEVGFCELCGVAPDVSP